MALKRGTITAYNQKIKFKLTVAVNVGDTIAFMNLTNGQHHNLSTGLRTSIKAQ